MSDKKFASPEKDKLDRFISTCFFVKKQYGGNLKFSVLMFKNLFLSIKLVI